MVEVVILVFVGLLVFGLWKGLQGGPPDGKPPRFP